MNAQRLYLNAKERWVAAGYPNYAPWVPLLFHGFTFAAAVIAVVQRIPGGDALPAAGLVALPLTAYFLCEVMGPRLHWLVFACLSLGPLGFLHWQYPITFDFTIFVIAMIVGRFSALENVRRSAAVLGMTLAGIVLVSLATDFKGAAFAFAIVIVGFDLGWLLQSQQRRIDQQEREQLEREARATLTERQRIAREVHDVVAHSLSVTLLHLTAARRDLEDGGDVDEAIDALREAERVGRQAMTDIRQTVGLLGQGQGELASTPDLGDVPALVQQFRAAGLDVAYETAGDSSALSAAVRIGLYRIVQESLANIAKHEPNARARVTLDLSSDPATLSVHNALTRPLGTRTGGSGLRGMNERAASFGASFEAGPAAGGWQVSVVLANPHAHSCPLPKLIRSSPETA